MDVAGINKAVRPVFFEELNLLGFDSLGWKYPETSLPLMWAEMRKYYYKGELVAEVTGGGLFTKPQVTVFIKDLVVDPVNLDLMIRKNSSFMNALVQTTLQNVYEMYQKYKIKSDVIYVAFSGGKDSLVLLDLIQRVLPHNSFKVVFGDTSMELSDTYITVDIVKERYSDLDFYIAKSHLDAKDTWRTFAPPGRVQRWCCAIHKSVPSILKLKEIVGKDNIRVVAFDGVRADESEARSTYDMESVGKKHLVQTNCSPILYWSTSELFLYIFENELYLNKAYRYGTTRVGCALCPMSSQWWEYIVNSIYPDDLKPFIDIISSNAGNKFNNPGELKKFLDTGGWKGRMGGRDLNNGGNRIVEQASENELVLYVREITCDWKEWIKTLGIPIVESENNYSMEYNGSRYKFSVENINDSLKVVLTIRNNTKDAIRFVYLFKNVFYKVAYCAFCKDCMVECPIGALYIEQDIIKVLPSCVHCHSCLDMPKGCLCAKSLITTSGGNKLNNLKGINRYQHFGFRKIWLQYFFEYKDEFWKCDNLGKYQFDAFKVWLKEADLTTNNILNKNAQALIPFGVDDERVWAIIFSNLAYNSVLINWYIHNISLNERYEIKTLVTLMGEDQSISTRENALSSLKETFRYSPIGITLGIGDCEIKGNAVLSITRSAWRTPNAIVLLYSLFMFAEKCDGHYSFTLSYLCDDTIERVGISPTTIFGIDTDSLKKNIMTLAQDYPEYITAAFNKDLDNIDLNKNKSSCDILHLL